MLLRHDTGRLVAAWIPRTDSIRHALYQSLIPIAETIHNQRKPVKPQLYRLRMGANIVTRRGAKPTCPTFFI